MSPLSAGKPSHHLPEFRPAETFFPAVTSVFQACFRTAAPVGEHGLVANGLFFRELSKVLFWEQSAALVRRAAHLGWTSAPAGAKWA